MCQDVNLLLMGTGVLPSHIFAKNSKPAQGTVKRTINDPTKPYCELWHNGVLGQWSGGASG